MKALNELLHYPFCLLTSGPLISEVFCRLVQPKRNAIVAVLNTMAY
jgi:hypothetical protein